MDQYKVLLDTAYSFPPLTLRRIWPDEIEHIRIWRNAQMDVLRQSSEINLSDQKKYFATHVWPEMGLDEPTKILQAIEVNGKFIGYGGLVHISWKDRRGEISFLLDPKIENDKPVQGVFFSTFLRAIRDIAFEHLNFQKLHTETYACRGRHIKIMEDVGMVREGVLRHHINMGENFENSILHAFFRGD